MAKISLNSNAPKDEAISFAFGATDFSLKDSSAVYETDDAEVIASAGAHPWLNVKIELPPADELPQVDMTDPQNNPKIDHLTSQATKETLDKAAAEAERIRKQADADVQDYTPETEAAKPETSATPESTPSPATVSGVTTATPEVTA